MSEYEKIEMLKEKLQEHIGNILTLLSTPIQNILSYGYNDLGMRDKLALFYRIRINRHEETRPATTRFILRRSLK